MKGGVLTLLLVFAGFLAKADQLAYLSKSDANKAIDWIVQQEYIYLFCGCCDGDTPRKVKMHNAFIRKTGYEDYYEVVLKYSEDGEVKEEGVDLAYTWVRRKNKFKTIGELIHLVHDICRTFPSIKE